MPLGVVLFPMFYHRFFPFLYLYFSCPNTSLSPLFPWGSKKGSGANPVSYFCLHLHFVLMHFDDATIWFHVRSVDL